MKFEDVASRDAVDAAGLPVDFYPMPTNGVTYLDIRVDFSVLTPEQQELLPLFGRVLTQIGRRGPGLRRRSRSASPPYTGGVGAAAQVQSLAAREDYVAVLRRLGQGARPQRQAVRRAAHGPDRAARDRPGQAEGDHRGDRDAARELARQPRVPVRDPPGAVQAQLGRRAQRAPAGHRHAPHHARARPAGREPTWTV